MRVFNRRWRGGSIITHNGAPLLVAQQEPHQISTSKKCIPHRILQNSVDATWRGVLASQQRFVTTHSQPLLAALAGGSVSSAAAVPDVDDVAKARLDNIAELVYPWLGMGVAAESVLDLVEQHKDRFTGVNNKAFRLSQLALVGTWATSSLPQTSGVVAHASVLGDNAGVYGLVFNLAGRWYALVKANLYAEKALFAFDHSNEALAVIKSATPMPGKGFLLELYKEFAEASGHNQGVREKFNSFQSLMRRRPQSIGQAFKALVSVKRMGIEGIPLNWNTENRNVQFDRVFRPPPRVMLPVDINTNVVSMNQPPPIDGVPRKVPVCTPYVFDGASGSGKTAAAVSMLETISSKHPNHVVFPAYINAYADGASLDNVAKQIVDDMFPFLDKCRAISSNDVSSLAFYIVLDELGKFPSLARTIINSIDKLIATLRTLLSKRDFAETNACIFEFSLAGAGITSPSANGSLPLHYGRVTFSVASGSVFKSRLAGARSTATGASRDEILAHLEAISGVCELLTNQRCAALLADAVLGILGTLGPFTDKEVVGFDFKGFLRRHAPHIERVTTLQYIRTNAWGTLRRRCGRCMPRGCCLPLPPSRWGTTSSRQACSYLVTGLGAVSDTLVLDNDAAAYASRGPIEGSAGRYLPMHTILAEFGQIKARSDCARLTIPVFSVIIATNILRDGLGGDMEGLSPAEYEDANTAMILGVMNAHMWSAAYHKKRSFAFDFQTFAPGVCKHTAQLTAPVFEQVQGGVLFDEWCAKNKMKTINVRDIVGGHNGMAALIAATQRSVVQYGVALLAAGDGGPLSDLTVITLQFMFGFDYKKYDEGGPIGMQALQKRCFQVGFNCLKLNVATLPYSPIDGAPQSNEPKRVLPVSLNAMIRNTHGDAEALEVPGSGGATICLTYNTHEAKVSMPFRIFHSHIREWQREERAKVLKNPSCKPSTPTAEMVVLCSPYVSLLPAEVVQMRFVGAELMSPGTDVSANVIAYYHAHPAGGGKEGYETQPEKYLIFESVTDESAVCSVEALVLSPLALFGRYEAFRTGTNASDLRADYAISPFELHYGTIIESGAYLIARSGKEQIVVSGGRLSQKIH